ncbi:lamin tail domain-containing protein [Longibacter sp.]|uniref:lamin tail domain-containing protein n=1 Tax=Longibacter sp. TaxID=2045415 RepID=UPI003EB8B4BF
MPVLSLVFLFLASVLPSTAQVPQESIYPGLTGQELIDAIRADYTPVQTLGYDVARDELYRYLDTERGTLVCVYGGYSVDIPLGEDPSSYAYQGGSGISAEHTWPQSKGAGDEPQKSDMHILYPAKQSINSARANNPFADISDAETDGWYVGAQSQSNTPTSNIDAWSESDGAFPGNASYSGRFEPREDHKGNAARAMFYYFVVHNSSISDASFFEAQRDALIDWHNADQVDVKESDRNLWIETKQGTANPFIADTTLVRRIFEASSGPTVQFLAGSTIAAESASSITLTVELKNPDGTGVDVDVALREGSSTADAADFGGFSTQTVSFSASAGDGTTKTVTVPITDDTAPEPEETGRFALENATGALVGAPGTTDITIADDDGTPPGLLISQYAEDGNVKGIELWNSGSTVIDFASTPLTVNRYANGGDTPATEFALATGTLAAGEVLVIADDGANAIWSSLGIVFESASLQFNGNDALEILLGGQQSDVLGMLGTDPGAAWTGGSVSTEGQNIALRPGITTPDADGWMNPSLRFGRMAAGPLDDGVGGDLDAFGHPPGEAPCPVPDAQPDGLNLSATAASLTGEFGAAATADEYLIVLSPEASMTPPPVSGTSYGEGDPLGDGSVVQSGPATTFTATGLSSSTTYSAFIYSVRLMSRIDGPCTGAPVYRATAPLTGTVTTSSDGDAMALFMEPFNDATQYIFGDGQSDARDGDSNYFTRTDGANINKAYTGANGAFFAGQDLDDGQVLGTAFPGTLTWTGIDVSGMRNLELHLLIAEDLENGGDIDETDYLRFEIRMDGGPWQPVLAFENDGSAYNTSFLEDTDFDGTGDGTSISSSDGTMVSFTKPVGSTGTTLDLRFTASVDAGDEDFAVDEIRITGESTVSSGSDGDIIVTEVMQNPSDLSDADGEYVELYNTTGTDIDLEGWTVRDDGSDRHVIGERLVVPAGGYRLLCKTLSAADGCSYAFGAEMAVANGADELELVDPDGTVVERIAYDGGAVWPDPNGAAMVFTGTSEDDTNDGTLWVEATARQPGFDLASGTDLGSPGIRGTDQRMDVVQTAADVEGWRLMAAPVPGLTVQWLVDNGAHVQGINQNDPSSDPNVFVRYDGPGGATEQEYWRPATDAADALEPGWGFLWNPNGTNLPTTFRTTKPSTLPAGDFTLSGIPTDEQWHVIGNPFPNPITIDDINLAARSFSTTLQVWDPSAATYRTLTQDTGADALAAMAGAWVQRVNTTGTSTQLTVPARSQSVRGAPFYKAVPGSDPGFVHLTLTGYDDRGEVVTVDEAATLILRDEAGEALDVYDARKLTPITASYATIAFDGPAGEKGALRAVASHDWPQERRDVPFDVVTAGSPSVATYRLTWPEVQIPAEYEISLIDRATDAVVDLRSESQYELTAGGEAQATRSQAVEAGPATVRVTSTGWARGSAGLTSPSATPLRRIEPSMRTSADAPATAKANADAARFVLVISTSPIPVEMATFTAKLDNRSAVLEWTTATEQANQGFHVEQRVKDEGFRAVGFVPGAGTTNKPKRYSFRSDPLDIGVTTFRLRQVDADGTETVTRTIDVRVRQDEPIVIDAPSPHPVTGTARIFVAVRDAAEMTVDLYDVLGRRIQTLHHGPVQSGQTVGLTIDGASLPSGIYFLRATGNGATVTRRISVVR